LLLEVLEALHVYGKFNFVCNVKHLQIKLLIPNGIELLGHCSRSFLHFAHLHCHVRIRGTTFIFCDQPLCADNYFKTDRSLVFHTVTLITYRNNRSKTKLIFKKLGHANFMFLKNTTNATELTSPGGEHKPKYNRALCTHFSSAG
jgi:hypothetical protein